MANLQSIKAALRNGAYAWPGGYPTYFICDDGGCLCHACTRKEWRNVVSSHIQNVNDGWRILAQDVNWEDPSLYCDHCGERIESAYADDETEEA